MQIPCEAVQTLDPDIDCWHKVLPTFENVTVYVDPENVETSASYVEE